MWIGEQENVGSWPFCFTFVRGKTEREVFAGFGADPARAVSRRWREVWTADPPPVQVAWSGAWLVARQEGFPPPGFRAEVWRRL